MGRIRDAINTLRYALVRKQVMMMNESEQRKIGLATYEAIYDAGHANTGDATGTCTVKFACPYDTHVRYHCLAELDRRKADKNDVLVDYVTEQDGNEWTLSVMVSAQDSQAMYLADACAMSAVLRIPTVVGDFTRTAQAFRNVGIALPTAALN